MAFVPPVRTGYFIKTECWHDISIVLALDDDRIPGCLIVAPGNMRLIAASVNPTGGDLG